MSPPFITFPQLNFIIKKKDSNLLTVNELPSLASVFNALPTHGGQVESAFYSSNGLLILSTSNVSGSSAVNTSPGTGTECRIFKSTDYGNTWQTAINMTGTWGSIHLHGSITPPSGKTRSPTDSSRINEKSISNLIYIESNPDVVYFTTRFNSFTSTDNGANIYKSFDGGANFALVGNWQTTEPTDQFESLHIGDVQPAPITGNPSVPIPKPLQGDALLTLGSGDDAGEAHKNVITLDVSQNYSAPTIVSQYKSPSSSSNYTQNLNTIIIPNGSISSIKDTSVSPPKYQIHTSFNSSHSLYPNFNTVSNLTTNNSQNFKFSALTSNGSDIIAFPTFISSIAQPIYSTNYGLSWSNFYSLPSGVTACTDVCSKDIEWFSGSGSSMGFSPVIFALVMLSTGEQAILYNLNYVSSSITWWNTLHTFSSGMFLNKIIPITDSSDDIDFFVAGCKTGISSPTNSTGQEPLLYRVNKPKLQ